MTTATAWEELNDFLDEEEVLEAIVLGYWGWHYEGYTDKEDEALPSSKRGVALSPTEAEPLMQSWACYGGYGAPDCYAMYAWTNTRVIWITQYDGSTRLSSAPRNPCAVLPEMPGG